VAAMERVGAIVTMVLLAVLALAALLVERG
jgi:hypothetical protein